MIGKWLCALTLHPRLEVIQTFGQAQHIGCPRCGRHYAIHHGLRMILPWDADFAKLYADMGYDVDRPLARWRARL